VNVEAAIRERAQDEVLRALLRLSTDLVRPLFERFGVQQFDADGNTTPQAEQVIAALVRLPTDMDELPACLVDREIERIIASAVRGRTPEAPPEPEPERPDLTPKVQLPDGTMPETRPVVPPFTDEFREKFRQRLRVKGECWEWELSWKGHVSSPQFVTTVHGVPHSFNVRRALRWLIYGVQDTRRYIATTCGNDECMNPDHLEVKR